MDVLNWVVSILALGVSGYSVWLTKTEPARARTQEQRDELREVLSEASATVRDLRRILDNADSAPDPAEAVEVAITTLQAKEARLPEQARLMRVRLSLTVLGTDWDRAVHAESRLMRARDNHHMAMKPDWSTGQPAPEQLRNAVEREHKAQAEHDAARGRLARSVEESQGLIERYIAWLDAKDREKARE